MMWRWGRLAALVGQAWLAGCANSPGERAKAPSSAPTAQRLYAVGEERFAAGRPDQAVTLWRHAITQLPTTERFDGLRHKLILRLGFGEVVAYHHTGKLVHLFDAKRMLERYVATHESLFGDAAAAKAERDQVYELLYEVESRIEDPPPTIAASSAVGVLDPDAARGVDGGGAGPTSAPAGIAALEPATPATTKPNDKRRRRRQSDAEGLERVVVVDTHDRPSVDDPEDRAKLTRWAPEAGLGLTSPSVEPWLPARAYVRIDGRARRLDDAGGGPSTQAVAAAVIRSVRPALRACYDGAFARVPADYATATIEFAVGDDGKVHAPQIVGGAVGDALGDACVLEQLADADASEAAEHASMRVSVNLLFFYDGAVMMNEGGGRSWRNELDSAVDYLAASVSARRRNSRGAVPRNIPPITQ